MLDKTKERPKNLDDKFQVFSFDPPEPEKVFSVNGFWGECDKENFYVRNIFSIRKRAAFVVAVRLAPYPSKIFRESRGKSSCLCRDKRPLNVARVSAGCKSSSN